MFSVDPSDDRPKHVAMLFIENQTNLICILQNCYREETYLKLSMFHAVREVCIYVNIYIYIREREREHGVEENIWT